MEAPVSTEAQKSNKGMIMVIVLIVLGICLVCVLPIIVIAILTIMGPVVGEVFSTINSSLGTPSP